MAWRWITQCFPFLQSDCDQSCDCINAEKVTNYLNNDHQFLDTYVLDNIPTAVLETWLTRKTRMQPGQSPRSTQFQLRLETNVVDFVRSIVDSVEMYSSFDQAIWEIAYCVAMALGSDGFHVYMVSTAEGETPSIHVLVGSLTDKPVRRVQLNREALPAIFEMVLGMKPVVVVRDNEEVGGRVKPKFALFLPVEIETAEKYVVYEIYRKQTKFFEEDMEISYALMAWIYISLHFLKKNEDLCGEVTLYKYIMDASKSIFKDMGSLDNIIIKIMKYARNMIQADRASLFLADNKSRELYATVFDVGIEGLQDNVCPPPPRPPSEIRFPIGIGIAGYVAQTGKTLNIKDAYRDYRFNRSIDQQTGYRTKTILCMPVITKKQIIGVLQMVNKKKGYFTTDDVKSVKLFATYCGLALQNAKLYTRIKRSEHKYKVALEVLSYHNTCHEREVKQALQEMLNVTLHSDGFEFNPFLLDDYEKAINAILMFIDLFDLKDFDKACLTRFVLTVRKNYRQLPYHNWAHGFAVCNTMYNILKRDGGMFTRNEKLALYIGSLCHDLDHRGKNNKFMHDTESPLAIMYSTSTMEHHHFNQTVIILQQEKHNIFSKLSVTDYKNVLSLLKLCILATDLAAFFPNRDKLLELVENDIFDWTKTEHRHLAMAITMTAADLSASAKPWFVQSKTVSVIFEEFYDQGDAEREAGRQPMPMMDRNCPNQQPSSQVGFLTGICIPCYKLLEQLIPATRPLLEMCEDNLQRWKSIERSVKKFTETEKTTDEITEYLQQLINYDNLLEVALPKRNDYSEETKEIEDEFNYDEFANISISLPESSSLEELSRILDNSDVDDGAGCSFWGQEKKRSRTPGIGLAPKAKRESSEYDDSAPIKSPETSFPDTT